MPDFEVTSPVATTAAGAFVDCFGVRSVATRVSGLAERIPLRDSSCHPCNRSRSSPWDLCAHIAFMCQKGKQCGHVSEILPECAVHIASNHFVIVGATIIGVIDMVNFFQALKKRIFLLLTLT